MSTMKLTNGLILMLLLGVMACRKGGGANEGTYTVRVFTDDANTAKVWRDTVGKTRASNFRADQQGPQGWDLLDPDPNPNQFDEATIQSRLWSAVDSNENDAKIVSVKISYKNSKGKEKFSESIGELAVGREFSREYKVPSNNSLIVSAKASQTGSKTLSEVKPLLDKGKAGSGGDLANGSQITEALRKYQDEVAGRRANDAKVSLKVEILKDGLVIGSQQIRTPATAEVNTEVQAQK